MSLSSRGLPSSHMRQQSTSGSLGVSSAGQSLQARVNEKRAELEELKQLRDLSAAVASQMEALEQKLATLSDGTEGDDALRLATRPFRGAADGPTAIATVVANWHNVLRAINMASGAPGAPAGCDPGVLGF